MLEVPSHSIFYILPMTKRQTFSGKMAKTLNSPTSSCLGELCLNGNQTVTEYEMSGEPHSQKSRWINQLIERNFR